MTHRMYFQIIIFNVILKLNIDVKIFEKRRYKIENNIVQTLSKTPDYFNINWEGWGSLGEVR